MPGRGGTLRRFVYLAGAGRAVYPHVCADHLGGAQVQRLEIRPQSLPRGAVCHHHHGAVHRQRAQKAPAGHRRRQVLHHGLGQRVPFRRVFVRKPQVQQQQLVIPGGLHFQRGQRRLQPAHSQFIVQKALQQPLQQLGTLPFDNVPQQALVLRHPGHAVGQVGELILAVGRRAENRFIHLVNQLADRPVQEGAVPAAERQHHHRGGGHQQEHCQQRQDE